MGLEFFDCNASLGVPQKPPLRYSADADGLLDEMDFCGIGRALVWHAAMRERSPVDGNARLTEAIAGKERLVGTWAILPHQTGEQPPPEEFLRQMAANDIGALWAWPRSHEYRLTQGGMGDLLAAVEARHVPLFVCIENTSMDVRRADWAAIEPLLRDFPNLTLCVTPQSNWGQDRYFRPLIERFERLHVGIESYELAGGLADFCERYGSRRLLFGSGYPRVAMGGARSVLEHADISDDDKGAIAGGNLKRLLAEVEL